MDDETLEKLAREEILSEAKRGAARADAIGPTGWEKCPLPSTNKRFLQNTLLNAVRSNKKPSKHSHKRKHSSKKSTDDDKKAKKQKTKDDNISKNNSKFKKESKIQ